MKAIRVRFNLSRGKNYMKWKLEFPTIRDAKGTITHSSSVQYLNPSEVILMMSDCVLDNHKEVAQKIFDGGNKTVCAWVLCKEIIVLPSRLNIQTPKENQLRYNPRIVPCWMLEDRNVDGVRFTHIISQGKNLFYRETRV
jgi:hypothetical protein